MSHSQIAAASVAFLLYVAIPAQDSRPGHLTLRVLARDGQAVLLGAGPQRVLCLKGSPREIGRQHGSLLADEVRTVVAQTLTWTYAQGLSRGQLQELRAAGEPFVPHRYAEELAGLAQGSGVLLEDLWLVHMMPSKFHCTGAAAARSATRDGKVYHLRSLDYALDIGVDSRLQSHAVLIVREDEDGIPSIVPSWAGVLGAVTGMNGAGIAVGEMGSQCNDEDHRGIPMIFQVREVLRRATTLAQAVAVFREGPATCGYHFIVSSGGERDAVALEVSRSHFASYGLGDLAENLAPHTALTDIVRRSNHFVTPGLAKTQRDPYDPRIAKSSSWQAYDRMTKFFTQRTGTLDDHALIELLRCYPKAHGCLHQAVFCASDLVLWVAQARDDRAGGFAGAQNQEFLRYDLRALLARDLATQVAVDRPASAAATAARRVVVRGAAASCEYRIEEAQGDRDTVILAAVPVATSTFPSVELHVPRVLATGAQGVILVGTAEPALIASRVIAHALAQAGVPTLILPLLTGSPPHVKTTVEFAAALRQLLPVEVPADRVAFLGLGLGAGVALRAAAQATSPAPAIVVFATADLARRVAQDRDTANWLGITSADLRKQLGDELDELGLATAGVNGARGRVLCIAAAAEAHLTKPAQEQLAQDLGARLVWHEGSVRSLQKDASALANAVRDFLRP